MSVDVYARAAALIIRGVMVMPFATCDLPHGQGPPACKVLDLRCRFLEHRLRPRIDLPKQNPLRDVLVTPRRLDEIVAHRV